MGAIKMLLYAEVARALLHLNMFLLSQHSPPFD
jgi:hypothetical protein